MGSPASIVIVGDVGGDRSAVAHAADAAVRRIEHLERCWSRFIPTSDISRLNAAGGRPVIVDAATIELVIAMVDAWRVTGGAFDPSLLGAINALGYASDWSDPTRHSCAAPAALRQGAVGGVLHDPTNHVVQLPLGMSVDAGGIGKGLAADLAAVAAVEEGALGALVELGGDLCARGEAPDASGWRVDVGAPDDDARAVARLALASGGIATSSTRRRRWQTSAGVAVHHLLDPADGLPATSRLVQATVVAGTGAWAEAWSTAVMVRGTVAMFPELDRNGLGAMALDADGTEHANAAWKQFDVGTRAVAR